MGVSVVMECIVVSDSILQMQVGFNVPFKTAPKFVLTKVAKT